MFCNFGDALIIINVHWEPEEVGKELTQIVPSCSDCEKEESQSPSNILYIQGTTSPLPYYDLASLLLQVLNIQVFHTQTSPFRLRSQESLTNQNQ